jgi:hypothetical protein
MTKTRQTTSISLKMMVVRDVLEAAKDAGDDLVVAACRRLSWANTLGRLGSDEARSDWAFVRAFAE